MAEISETELSQALTCLREFEQKYLGDPVHGFNNPFNRPGVPVKQIAMACGLVKKGADPDDRPRADMPAARRLVKELVEKKLAESTGSYRTMSAGSSSVECFALPGFMNRLAAAQEGRREANAQEHDPGHRQRERGG